MQETSERMADAIDATDAASVEQRKQAGLLENLFKPPSIIVSLSV